MSVGPNAETVPLERPRRQLTPETKIGIPVAVFGAWAIWLSAQIIEVKTDVAFLKGQQAAKHAQLPEPEPLLPAMPHGAQAPSSDLLARRRE